MLKVFAFLTKLPALSDEQFFAHWRHPHGTLTKKIPHIKRYAQNHRVGAVPGLAASGATGVAVIWLDDAAALGAMAEHPDYPELDADGDNMYLRGELSWLVSDPVRSVDGGATVGAKAMLFLAAPAGSTIDRGALDRLAAEAASLDGVAEVNTALASDPAASAFGAVIELSFADEAAFRAAWDAGGAAFLARLGEFADVDRSRGMLAREERVIWPAPVEA